MSYPKLSALSESEEMYLLTIEKLRQDADDEMVPLSQIARSLSIQPVSVNQMIRKLDNLGYVEYYPYKGVKLSEKGEIHTQSVLRFRRIWKTFLNQELGIPIHTADELACRFEHITPQEVINRLYKFIGEPSVTPEGEPIAGNEMKTSIIPKIPLTNIAIGQTTIIQDILGPHTTTEYLATQGVKSGAEVTLLAIGDQGAVLMELGQEQISLVEKIASKILVSYRAKAGPLNAIP
jgi:DtxR family Mn-dependent transcriptional regulator